MMCNTTGCPNEGQWHPVFHIYVHRSHSPAVAILPLLLCDDCKAKTTLEEYLTDDGWQKISDGFVNVGYQRPKRELTSLYWIRPKHVPPNTFMN